MPLLQLLARLRGLVQADPDALRLRTDAELQAFEARALAAGLPSDQVRRGGYALCESLDDAVLSTPWGAGGTWARQPLVAAHHSDVGPGRFFDMLRQAQGKAGGMRPVLELLVVLMSLGMMGRYRTRLGGAAEVEAIRAAATAALLADGPPAPSALSERWEGVAAPFRRRRARLPVWVAASAGLAGVAGVYLLLSAGLNDTGDALFARMLDAPPAVMPQLQRDAAALVPTPPAAAPGAQDRLRSRLAAQTPVEVAGTPAIPVLRLPEHALFPPGSATLTAAAGPLLQAVATAVRPEGGRLHVVGHLDDRPVRSVAFPSSFKLSAARAEAVRAALARSLGGVIPAAAEGRAGADPVAPNTTPEGRERNRRVDVVLEGAAP